MEKNVETFIGCEAEYEDAKIVLFGAPFDSTTSFRPGARFGSSSIRHESFGLETYSPYQDKDLMDVAVFDSGDLELCFGSSEAALSDIEVCATQILDDGKLPVMIGGEHLVTLGVVRAVCKKYPDLHVIHFDAHADLRDDYLGATLSHACVLRRCHELLGDGRIHQFCIRSGEKAEFEFAKAHTDMHPFDFEGLKEVVDQLTEANAPVYVTIDLDCLDPSVFPGTGTPEAGGVTFMQLQGKTATKITTAQVDADDVQQVIDLIRAYQPDLVMNIALPYQDLTIMDACLACGVNYMDTANYESEDTDDPKWREIYEKRCKEQGFSAYFDYSWQWAYREKFEKAGLTALLGCGFDPGVTQAYCAYAKKHEFDTINTIDILDCNGGDHGYAFATNFNPEVNLREVSAPGSYWEDGHWVEIPAMSIKREYDFDGVGEKDMYLLHHEEIESLALNIPEVKRIRFFMTFGQSYLTHMKCLENVGMLSTTPVDFEGTQIVPIKFLKALLPDPASLGPRTHGKTNIGCIFTGEKEGEKKSYYIYNVCDHQECYREVESQAISYTTGVPAMCGALMLLTGKWDKKGVHTVEEFDPDPFLDALDKYGLPRRESHDPVLVD